MEGNIEALLEGTLSLTALALFAFVAGVLLLFWGILRHGIKVGPVVLPPITRKHVRAIVLFLALCLATFGGWGIWDSMLRPEPSLKMFTGLGEEEFQVFREVITEFEEDHGVTVELENLAWQVALDRMEEEKVDLVTFDVNGSFELVRRGLIDELSEEKFKGLIPSSVNPILLEHLEVFGKRYFAPYRSNVQLVFLNEERFTEIGIDSPKTWQDVMEAAKIFYERDGKARVGIQATDEDIPTTLLQIIRSAGGIPYNLLNPRTKMALEFVQQLYTYVSPTSSQVNWQTAPGFLLTDNVYVARNWTFTIGLLHTAGRDTDFEVYSGWSWSNDSKPSNLLGGEFLALPKNARHKELAIELMKFLMSREVQEKLAAELSWPAMRLDATGEVQPWLQSYQGAINTALEYAEPVPDYWWPEIPDIYRRMFHEIISLDLNTDIQSTLAKFQSEIDAVVEARRQ